ncbi:RNA polymerase sigma-70 factor [uncultured Parabacteroides sp.]|uniref:RNA polymerase sigma-70 factor n=1 Tax=uncultured Parabacteroides sp. TaxID=512312 RepID=UPI002603A362|nr:RNA polymerase sigma-70 factor [uncultured Parabacteroides sp.]
MKDNIVRSRELDKFKLLYLENAPRLIFYASKYVDEDTAEDLVHDIFIKIWQKKDTYFLEEGLKTYLFRSVQNACLDYLKHKSIEMTYADEVARKLKIEEIHYYNNQSDVAELEKERLESVYREIAKLPDRCREIFTLAYVDGKKSAEIAGMLNISQRTVEAQLYKGLKIIRNILAFFIQALFFP